MNTSRKDLGRELLGFDHTQAGQPPDPRVLTQTILRRDRWRIWLLGGGTIVLWLVAAALIMPLIAAVADGYLLFERTMDEVLQKTGADRQLLTDLRNVATTGRTVAGAATAMLVAATVLTVLLIVTSRRATLRQVNANLIAISEQLRQIRPAG